jgi:hypothetical protein
MKISLKPIKNRFKEDIKKAALLQLFLWYELGGLLLQ